MIELLFLDILWESLFFFFFLNPLWLIINHSLENVLERDNPNTDSNVQPELRSSNFFIGVLAKVYDNRDQLAIFEVQQTDIRNLINSPQINQSIDQLKF